MAEIKNLQSSFLCILAVGLILLITVKFPHTFKYKSHHIRINTLNSSIRNSHFKEASLQVHFQSYPSHSSNPEISITETQTSPNNFDSDDDTLQDSTANELLKHTNSQIRLQSKTYFVNNINQISIDKFESLNDSGFNLTPEIHYHAKSRLTNLISLEFLNETNLHESQPWQINWKSGSSMLNQSRISLGIQNRQMYKIGEFVPVNEAKNILIVTRGRSGSSFLGDLLNRYPGTFYTFEPLHQAKKRGILTTESKVALLKQVFNCSTNDEFFIHAKEWKYSLSRNIRYWKSCYGLLGRHYACYIPELYNSLCSIFPIRLIKTIRLSFSESEELLKDAEIGKSLKIIFLFRDPRGVQQSMKEICDNPGWKFGNCDNVQKLCEVLDKDTLGALEMKQKYPDRVHLIRYEDICIDTTKSIDGLLKFLDLPNKHLINSFIEQHTQAQTYYPLKKGRYNTKRNSSEMAFAWRKKSPIQDVLKVQDFCDRPMKTLGYIPIDFDLVNNTILNYPVMVDKTSLHIYE